MAIEDKVNEILGLEPTKTPTQKEEFKSIILNNDGDISYLFKSLEEFIIK